MNTLLGSVLSLLTLTATSVSAETLTDADAIVARANLASYYAGADGRSEVRMMIRDEGGAERRRQFTILRRDVADGGDQAFLVVFSRPADVRGTTYLVEKHAGGEDDRWLYLPGLDLVKRISAGDERTSFVGSHFFYEDVSGRSPRADTHTLIETTDTHYVLSHEPLDPQSVEFTSYTTWIDRTTFLPRRIEFANARGIYRRMEALEIEEIDGYPTVTRSLVSDLVGGGSTEMMFRFIRYDIGVPEDVFSERSLRRPPAAWLNREG